MLNDAPDDTLWDIPSFAGAHWVAVRDFDALPDAGALMNLLATTREMASGIPASLPGVEPKVQSGLRPEHISGFCAAG